VAEQQQIGQRPHRTNQQDHREQARNAVHHTLLASLFSLLAFTCGP
jgi:hypothetical protein